MGLEQKKMSFHAVNMEDTLKNIILIISSRWKDWLKIEIENKKDKYFPAFQK